MSDGSVQDVARQPGDMLNVSRPVADALNEAAISGQFDRVKELLVPELASGVDVTTIKDDMGMNALDSAVMGGQAQIVEFLLESGYDKHFSSGGGEEALAAAGANGMLETLKQLLQHGAIENKSQLRGDPCIVQAARAGHLAVVQHLLDANVASVDQVKTTQVQNSYGGNFKPCTALVAASENGHLDVVKLLIEHKANFEAKVGNGDSALCRAVRGKHEDVAVYLRSCGAKDRVAKETETSKQDVGIFAKLNLDLGKGRGKMAHGNISRD